MTYFWVRPLCRVFGLLFLLLGGMGLISSMLYLIDLMGLGSGAGSQYPAAYAVEAVARPFAYLAIGGWFFWGARSVERLVARGLYPAGCCQRCGYNLKPAGLSRCPECGHEEATQTGP